MFDDGSSGSAVKMEGMKERIVEREARRLLGVDQDATAEDVRAARRRLAKQIHPDVEGGSDVAMRRLNEAAETVLEWLGAAAGETPAPPPSGGSRRRRPTGGERVAHDVASFVIEAGPAEAAEALQVVTSWLGEVVNEEPSQLDVLVSDPLRCWCRLDLLAEAGATTVSLTIAAVPDGPLPDIDDVRDLWVASLNQLGSRS